MNKRTKQLLIAHSARVTTLKHTVIAFTVVGDYINTMKTTFDFDFDFYQAVKQH